MKPMQKLLLIPFLLPLTGCAIIEIVDKATKISQTLKTTNQPIVVRCNNTNTKLINTYTIDPNKDEVIAEEWKSDQLDETKTTEIWELTERKTTSYIIENISRIAEGKDKEIGPVKIKVNLVLGEVTLSKNLHTTSDNDPTNLFCSIDLIKSSQTQ